MGGSNSRVEYSGGGNVTEGNNGPLEKRVGSADNISITNRTENSDEDEYGISVTEPLGLCKERELFKNFCSGTCTTN